MILVYCGPFLLLGAIPLLFYIVAPWAPVIAIATLLAALLSAELVSRRGPPFSVKNTTYSFRLIPLLYVPLQLIVILWGLEEVGITSRLGFAALALAVGVTTGVFGMLAAHELVHSKNRYERMLGTLMLTGMSYRHFRVAHLFIHHRFAGTGRDPSTARLGEAFYTFLVRTVVGQVRDGWHFERRRCARRRLPFLVNRLHQDLLVMAAVFAAFFAAWGWTGVGLFAIQSAIGIVMLELFNYIAHYGLVRRVGPLGQIEAFDDRHSWNSSNVLANAIIFNMGRHSDHHRRASTSFEALAYVRKAPELPAGYAGSIMLALVPALWRRVMDPAVAALDRKGDAQAASALATFALGASINSTT